MTAITPPETRAVAQAGRLRGFASGAREIDDAAVQVRGTLPPWLRGTLLLNGPALWDLPNGSYRHWFDGLAMLHRIRLGEGEPCYRSRFLRSEDYRASTAAGKPAFGGFGTPEPPGLWRRIRSIFAPEVTDNCVVVMSRVGGRWAATTESPRVVGFDADTLETTGELAFQDQEKLHLMAAHGINDAGGNYWNVGIAFGPQCTYKLFRVRPDSMVREVVGQFQAKEAGYLHAFAMTPSYAIVWEPAWRARPLSFVFTGRAYMDHFVWKPETGSRIHAIRLRDGTVHSWDIPPMMCFHAIQAYEDGGALVAELVVYDDSAVVRELDLQARRQGVPFGAATRLTRYRLVPGQRRAEPQIFAHNLELPQVHPSRWGRTRASMVWGSGMGDPDHAPFLQCTMKLDLATGATTMWDRGGAVQLEPLFVAPPGSQREDEGVLLVPTLTDSDEGTVIAVLDPATMHCMAELQLPQVVPFGFHAAWQPN